MRGSGVGGIESRNEVWCGGSRDCFGVGVDVDVDVDVVWHGPVLRAESELQQRVGL